ncbi:MAG: hypothetical protein J6D26_04795 [Clostridia bacterium]|nr:hypothetical protein [Clostridia bacterium]
MKRLTVFLLVLVLALGCMSYGASAEEADLDTMLKINSEYQQYDLILVTLARANYQLLAPARPFAEALGAELEWDGENQQITLTKDDKTAVITLDAPSAMVNGEEVILETPAQLVGATSYLPVEFVGKSLGYRVLREQYGRYVRLVSSTNTTSPYYNGDIKPGMAELISDYHRPVPTEFERSNELDDLMFYTDYEYIPEEELLKEKTFDMSKLPSGEVIYTNDDFVDSSGSGETVNGWWKPVEIDDEGVDFDRAVQICCTYPPSNTTFFIVKPTKRIESYVDPKDKYLVKFSVRLVGGGHVDTGAGKVYVHVEESDKSTWIKSVEETVEFGSDWTTVYAIATGVDNANHIGVTTGFWRQTIEIGGFEVQKLDRNTDITWYEEYKKPVDLISPELSKDAPWRQEALDRIEEVRKGDFKVVVQDKEGNPVEGAEVEFDMFEHEFRFGAVLDASFWNQYAGGALTNYINTLGVNFNSVGAGNGTKLEDTDSNLRIAKRKFDDAKNLGIKHFRGHVLWMPSLASGDVGPYRFYGHKQPESMDWATFENYVKNHFNHVMTAFPEITELEVANEMVNRVTWDSRFGPDYLHELFYWADEIRKKNGYDDMKLGYCDNQIGNAKYWEKLDSFQAKDLPYEVLVHQGHSYDFANDPYANVRRVSTYLQSWDRFVYEYEKQFTISEFSCSSDTQEFQADFTRDVLIAAFSHPGCEAFNIFWYSDVWSGSKAPAGCAPLYDKNFKPKLGLNQWQDLIYNKWWTKDAITTTDSEGKGQVRGFYGDYDITVTVDGKPVKTEMAAFHKGYENELVITLQ